MAIPLVAAVAWPLYGGGFVNYDAMWSLVWGDELAHLNSPSFEETLAPTPHPLSNLVGMLLAPLGADAETALHLIGYGAIGGLVVATGAVAYRLFGVVAAVIAGALMLTRNTLATYGALAYLDIAYAALIVWAVALEAERPRRGWPVLTLFGIAGLLRPEAWFLAAGYAVWFARAAERRTMINAVLLVAAAPLIWVVMDLLATGDPLFSFTHTRDAAEDFGRIVGVSGLIEEGPRVLGRELRPAVTVAALAGFAIVVIVRRSWFLLAWTAATGAAFALPVAAGTPLNARYLLPVIALACVAAAGALTAWRPEDGRRRIALGAAAAALAVLLLATAPSQEQRLRDDRERLDALADRRDAARDVVEPGLPCLPVTSIHPFLTPLVALWTDTDVDSVRALGASPAARGSFLWATPQALEGLAPTDRLIQLPPDARTVRSQGGWALRERCAAAR